MDIRRILIDLDGVLADFDAGFMQAWQAAGHPYPPINPECRQHFRIMLDYPAHLRADVESIYTRPGFYRSLPPIRGAIDAVTALESLGHDIIICTTSDARYPHCVTDKHAWVERFFGSVLARRMLVEMDKTTIPGDILIDDCPHIDGTVKPQWDHVLYDQPYNRHVDRIRLDWMCWKKVWKQMRFGSK